MTNKILLVEDDVDLCATYQDALEAVDYQCASVHRGDLAIERLTQFLPDIVILDLNLPRASGHVVLGYIKNHFALSRTKVVIVSGEERMIQSVTKLWGVDRSLLKPVSPVQLQSEVKELLQKDDESNEE